MPIHDSRYCPASALGRRRVAPHLAACLLAGLALAVAPAGITRAQNLPQAVQSARDPIATHVTEAAQRFGIPVPWIYAVVRIESGGDPHAVSPAGAMGLMQIMPGTWVELRARHGLGSDPFDPRDNILAGAAYLRDMWDRYGNIGARLRSLSRVRTAQLPRRTCMMDAMPTPRRMQHPCRRIGAHLRKPRTCSWRGPARETGNDRVRGKAQSGGLPNRKGGKAERRTGRKGTTGLRQDKSACADHAQAIGMACFFLHRAVGRAYAPGIFPANSKVFCMRDMMDVFRR